MSPTLAAAPFDAPTYQTMKDFVGRSFLIDVVGYVMLQKLDSGKHRIIVRLLYGEVVAYIFKPRGKKRLVIHRLSDLIYSEEQKTYCQNHVNFLSELVLAN